MIDYIQTFYSVLVKLFYVLFFCFLYIPLFNKCNLKKKIKKNGKTKIISQPKSVLAFTYLILLFILFKCFTFKMVLFTIISILIGSLVLFDKLSPKLDEILYKFNKSDIMILCWKLLHTIFAVINIITQPLFSIINEKINKKILMMKKFIIQVANLSDGDNSAEILNKELLKISDDISTMSDYIFKSKYEDNKKNIKTLTNETDIMSDIKTNDCITTNENNQDNNTSSKQNMEKKINEINKVIDTSNVDSCDDLTFTENTN